MLPIAEQAVKLVGERKVADEAVFPGLDYSAWNNIKLREWVMRAVIRCRDIRFSWKILSSLSSNIKTEV